MRITDFKSTNEILDYLDKASELELEYEEKLDDLKCSIFDKSYKINKKKQEKIYDKLDHIGESIDKIHDFIMGAVTFDCDLFLEFMVKFLELMENKPYAVVGQMVSYNSSIFEHNFGLTYTPIENVCYQYNIITSLENAEEIRKLRKSSLYDGGVHIDDVLNLIEDQKYICLKNKRSYCMLEGTTLKESFAMYPYLLKVAMVLIDLKLRYPQLSDVQRLSFVYYKVKNKKENPENQRPRGLVSVE